MPGLVLRKHADKSSGRRVVRFDPETGAKKLVNPDTPGEEHEPWPLSGVTIEFAPDVTVVSTTLVEEGRHEGWLAGENGRPVVRPAGRTQSDWNSSQTGQPHVFIHYDRLVFHTIDGSVAYRVTHQPDKYAAEGDDDTPVTADVYAAGATRVDHFYCIQKED